MIELTSGRRPAALVLVATALALLTATATSSGATNRRTTATSEQKSSRKLTACPTGPSAGAPPSGIPMATTVRKTSWRTSIVIRPTGPQMRCGNVPVRTFENVVYASPQLSGQSAMPLKMDILVPRTADKKPLLIYLPGGGFVQADPAQSLNQRTYMADAGYVVASVQYPTVLNGATYVQAIEAAKAAIRYLRAHARRHDINQAKVAVWGESAGGYLAAMVGVSNGNRKLDVGADLKESSDVQDVVDMFGLSDLATSGADFDPAYQQTLAAPGSPTAEWVFGPGTTLSIDDDPTTVALANPVTHVNRSDPPFVLFHGSDDHLVSPSQTLLLHTALRAKGASSTRYIILGAGHGILAPPKAARP